MASYPALCVSEYTYSLVESNLPVSQYVPPDAMLTFATPPLPILNVPPATAMQTTAGHSTNGRRVDNPPTSMNLLQIAVTQAPRTDPDRRQALQDEAILQRQAEQYSVKLVSQSTKLPPKKVAGKPS